MAAPGKLLLKIPIAAAEPAVVLTAACGGMETFFGAAN
jgi:hypothetical protein